MSKAIKLTSFLLLIILISYLKCRVVSGWKTSPQILGRTVQTSKYSNYLILTLLILTILKLNETFFFKNKWNKLSNPLLTKNWWIPLATRKTQTLSRENEYKTLGTNWWHVYYTEEDEPECCLLVSLYNRRLFYR